MFIKALFSVGFVLVLVINTEAALRCRRCDRTTSLDDCTTSVTCSSDEVCYMDEVITPQLTIVYESGCRAKDVCDEGINGPGFTGRRSLSKRDDIIACSRCCNVEYPGMECNAKLCGIKYTGTNASRCYHCDSQSEGESNVKDPTSCSDISKCNSDEVCGSELQAVGSVNEHRFTCLPKRICTILTQEALKDMKRCKDPAAVLAGECGNHRRSNTRLCTACCGDSLCNSGSCFDLLDRLYVLWDGGVLNFETLKTNGTVLPKTTPLATKASTTTLPITTMSSTTTKATTQSTPTSTTTKATTQSTPTSTTTKATTQSTKSSSPPTPSTTKATTTMSSTTKATTTHASTTMPPTTKTTTSTKATTTQASTITKATTTQASTTTKATTTQASTTTKATTQASTTTKATTTQASTTTKATTTQASNTTKATTTQASTTTKATTTQASTTTKATSIHTSTTLPSTAVVTTAKSPVTSFASSIATTTLIVPPTVSNVAPTLHTGTSQIVSAPSKQTTSIVFPSKPPTFASATITVSGGRK